ncbi:Cullin binding-domain-containing protein [Gaertneriomyces semiglobifer]|nr:Cullin binding-domain-containing protein [Gaertneriomyces semiglobifer]
MTQFCEDLGISLESIEILIVARKLNAKNMGFFTKDEWLDGMRRMEVDSTEKLKMRLPELRLAYEKPAEFRDLYMFAFDFAKENDARKYLSLELATGLWNLLMPPDKHAHVSKFLTFLSEEKPVQAINKDQWKSFLDFSETVKEDLTGYDETSAWPVLFDDYVTWRYRADA